MKDESIMSLPMTNEEIQIMNEKYGFVKRTKSPFNTSGLTRGVTICSESDCYDNFEDSSCSVCYQDFEIGNNMIRLPNCGHIYHEGCINRWLRIKMACPCCRSNLRENM